MLCLEMSSLGADTLLGELCQSISNLNSSFLSKILIQYFLSRIMVLTMILCFLFRHQFNRIGKTVLQPLYVKDFRHFYFCTSETSIMKVIIPMNKNDKFSLTVFTEGVSSHNTHRKNNNLITNNL